MKIFDLHKHSHFSTFDAIPKPIDYAQHIAEHPDEFIQALSLSEHGTMQGFADTFNQAKKFGLKYVPSVEFYFQREFNKDERPTHLIAFAITSKGYYELININNMAVKRGNIRNYKPVITMRELETVKEISISGACVQGYWNVAIKDDLAEANKRANELLSLFGNRCYFELQTFFGEEQKAVNEFNIYFAKKNNAKMIITSDAHVINQEDCKYINVNRAMMFSQTLKQYQDKFGHDVHNTYLKTYSDYMREIKNNSGINEKILTECVSNLSLIADSVELIDINRKQRF